MTGVIQQTVGFLERAQNVFTFDPYSSTEKLKHVKKLNDNTQPPLVMFLVLKA